MAAASWLPPPKPVREAHFLLSILFSLPITLSAHNGSHPRCPRWLEEGAATPSRGLSPARVLAEAEHAVVERPRVDAL
jgi:hypothetical protein